MDNEQTNKSDTTGKEADKSLESDGIVNPILSEAKSLAQRIEAGNKKQEELQKKQEQLLAEQALSGTSGGHVAVPVISPEEQKKIQAKEFFKGTQLEEAIDKL